MDTYVHWLVVAIMSLAAAGAGAAKVVLAAARTARIEVVNCMMESGVVGRKVCVNYGVGGVGCWCYWLGWYCWRVMRHSTRAGEGSYIPLSTRHLAATSFAVRDPPLLSGHRPLQYDMAEQVLA